MTHDAGRLHKQHNNEDCEHNRVLPHGKTDRRNKRLKKTDGKAADHGAGNRADAAENRRDERLQTEH